MPVPQKPNNNGSIATPGERGSLVRASVTLVIAIVAVIVLPAHASIAGGSSSALAGNLPPSHPASTSGSSADFGEIRSAPGIPWEPAPRAAYPSDRYTTMSRSGPVPHLRSAIDRHNFPAVWAQGYQGQGVNVAVVDQGLDFGHPDLNGSYAVEGNATSPYYQWPLAFDPKSMAAYLGTGRTEGTSYANTSVTGPGPFEITHTITVDGTNDFGESERMGTDSRDNSGGAAGGDKQDFDLTDLYATRDANRWYFGFNAYLRQANDSYVLLLDLDNETSGTTTVPAGKLADTNTSASDIVTDIAISPSGLQIATVSADRYLRVWDRTGQVIFAAQAHSAKPSSVAWSPDGTMIATADPNVLLIWDPVAGRVTRQVQYVPLTDTPIDENAVLGWSPNSTWVGAGTSRYVHVINALTGVRFGTLWATNSQVNAVRFNRIGTQIATALGDGTVAVFNVNVTNIQAYPPVTRAFPAFTLAGGHSQAVLDAAWSSDDSRIVSGGRDNLVVLWDVASGMVITSSGVSGGWVTGVEWRKDGFGFITVSAGLAPVTPPRLIYWTNAGAPALTIPLTGALNGVDTSVLGEIGTASSDLSARLFNLGGTLNRILVAHKPDAAIVVDGWSRYSDRDQSFTHGLDIATFYRWNASSGRWDGTGLFAPSVNGTQASFQFGERLFNEISLPRSLLGDPAGISMELFSAGRAPTKPQDTAPTDPNVNFKNLDFGPGPLSLGAFAYVRPGMYTVAPSITSVSGTFHFGYHPSPILTRLFGAVGLLVVDPAVADRYDKVYVDLNNDHRFDATDVNVDRARPVAALDSLDGTGAPGSDGIADVSGGILYFIANGADPIPYSDRYVQLQLTTQPNLMNRIPEAGDLVAFLGEFRLDPLTGAKSEHGTRLASTIVGRGLLNPPAIGVAPQAKLVALANALDDVISSWYFAVEGYDGAPGTGDEAQVVLSPFTFPTLPNDGSDVFSRTADYLSEVHSGARALFVAPAGDNGFGYGSIASPASGPGVLAIGRTEDGTGASSQEGGPEGPNPHFLDPAIPSARGPTAIGSPKPDLVAIGTAITDLPLQSASGGGTTAVASTPMTGTDVASAIVAGAAALVRQAAGGGASVDRIAQFLRSGAVDLSHDPLVQGSGFLDVAEAVRLARGGGGILASPATLVAGTYRGARTEAFPRTLAPGGSDALTLRLENRGTMNTPVTISDAAYTLLGTYSLSNATVRDAYSPNGDIVFWVNGTGVSKVEGTTLAIVQVLGPIPGAWGSADLVKVTATSEFSRLVWPQGTTFAMNYSYTLSALDWEMNGTNWAGLPFGPYPAPSLFPNELNMVSQTAHQANVLEVRVREPATSLRDGLAIRLAESQSGSGLADLPWAFTVELYRRADWAWVLPAPASTSIPASATIPVTVTIAVPSNAGLGIYEGVVLVTNTSSGRTAAVPLIVNVGTVGPDLHLGGNLLSTDLYDNSRLFGGYDLSLRNNRIVRPYTGDWRFYFVDIPDAGMFVNPRGLKIVIDLTWGSKPSDLDIQVFGKANAADAFSTDRADRYGPAPLTPRAKTEELDKPEFKTATNESEDVLTLDLRPGLNVIAIHAARLKGDAPAERAEGRGGWARVRSSVDIATPDLAGSAAFTFVSSLDLPDGLRASAVGPATTTSFRDEAIAQDWQSWWNFPNFGEFLYRGTFTFEFTLQKALILEVHLQGAADVTDLDLGVFRDTNDNGVLDIDEARDANSRNRGGVDWQYDADGDADETVKWIGPPDGRYFVKVLGFTVNAAPGHFDLDVAITLDTGKGYEIPQAPKPTEIVQGTETGLQPLRGVDFSLAWDFPGETTDGDYGGAVLLGFPRAPGVLVIPVSVGLDRVAPTISGFSLSTTSGRLNDADNRTTTDPSPTLVWSAEDPSRGELDITRVSLTLDGADVTSGAQVTILLRANAQGVQGFWDGTIQYIPKGLTERAHEFVLTVGDLAGNLASQSVTIVLDTTAPPLAIEGAAIRYTRTPVETITVVTSPGGSLSFGGSWVHADATGRYSATLPLSPGENEIRVTAADWFDRDVDGNPVPGNANRATITIVRDNRPPTFSRAPASDAPITRGDGATILGILADEIAPGTAGSIAGIELTVAGTRTAVRADGSFAAVVPLVEGANTIEVRAIDLAGNEARAWANVTRDATAPALSVDPIPTRVTEGQVVVSGHAEPGSIVTVNGLVVPLQGDRFSRNVILSGGDNHLVVRAEDGAGNSAERRFAVAFVSPTGNSSTGIGLAIALIVIAGIIAFLLGRRFLFPGDSEEEPEPSIVRGEVEGSPPLAALEEPVVMPQATSQPEEPAPQPAESVAERELEEAALKDLDSFEAEESVPPVPEDPRVTKLREAFETGKISRDVYEANLKRLGKAP